MNKVFQIEVVIFSYNRGHHLLNCIKSIEDLVGGCLITVFDDLSTDKQTKKIVQRLQDHDNVRVIFSNHSADPSDYENLPNGGLHRNMQTFLDECARTPLALFLQDDTQIVRRVTEEDLQEIFDIFHSYKKAAFIYPAFLANRSPCVRASVNFETVLAEGSSFAFHDSYDYSGYFDICIANLERLRAHNWQFGNELSTSLAARSTFGAMRLLKRPFVGLLPSPPTYRSKGKSWVHSAWEFFRAGLYPIDQMSYSDLKRLDSLKGDYPTADSFLRSSAFWGEHPWPYSRLERAPGFIIWMDRIERGARRLSSRFMNVLRRRVQ